MTGQNLPKWDLSDLYRSIDDESINKDLLTLAEEAKALIELYKGKIVSLSGDELADAIARYEEFQALASKLGSYPGLKFATDMNDPKVVQFYQNTSEQLNEIGNMVMFFYLETNRIPEDKFQKLLVSSIKLQKYAPWLRDIRIFIPHQLSDDLELLLSEKFVTGRMSWTRLYDESLSSLKFIIDGKEYNTSQALHFLGHKDGEMRKKAAKSIGHVLGNNAKVFAHITNVLAKDKQIEDKWRKYERPISSRNLDNLIEDEVVENLITTVKGNYHKLAHKYYEIKAAMFGTLRLNYWDRNAPFPDSEDRTYSWEEAKDIVLKAYAEFSPQMADIAKSYFDNGWIDAAPKDGKDSGAFMHPCTTLAHPYVFLNFHGKARDVMTLAHELGHGVHQILSNPQGQLMASTPLTLAETASVFGEQLVFRALLKDETDPVKRKYLIASKVEDMLNTVVRQIAFCDFETKIHAERKDGELTLDRINKLWLEVQTGSLGPAIAFEDEYKYYWSYISHFIHAPFYVYAYAFGDCLVNSLYRKYQEQPEGFAPKYIEMLQAGGTKRHKDLLEPFGLDATKADFWQKGLDMISELIEEI